MYRVTVLKDSPLEAISRFCSSPNLNLCKLMTFDMHFDIDCMNEEIKGCIRPFLQALQEGRIQKETQGLLKKGSRFRGSYLINWLRVKVISVSETENPKFTSTQSYLAHYTLNPLSATLKMSCVSVADIVFTCIPHAAWSEISSIYQWFSLSMSYTLNQQEFMCPSLSYSKPALPLNQPLGAQVKLQKQQWRNRILN